MKRYGKYVKPYMAYFILCPICMLTEVAGDVVLPAIMAKMINIGAGGHDVQYIVTQGILMILLAFVMMGGGILGSYFAAKASVSFCTDLRSDLFKKVQEFSFRNIDSFSTGSLITRLTNDVTQVQNVINMGLKMFLRAPGMMVGAIIMAFMMNAKLAMVFVVAIPALGICLAAIILTAFPRFMIMQKKLDALNNRIQEALTGIRIIKSFVRDEFENEKFAESNADLKNAGLHALKVVIMTMPLMMLAMNVTTLAVVWVGGNQIIDGVMQIGDLTAFTTYIVQILMSLMMLAFVLLGSTRAIASVRRINEVLDTTIDLSDENASKKELCVQDGRVEFRHVSFSYYKESAEKVLNDINLTIEPGEMVGIIGSTGCGKTTLVQMIPRLYDVDEGSVLVSGVDVKEYGLHNLRDGVGMVLQKNVLFSGTIAENLRWGDKDATDEQLRAVSENAQASEFVEKFEEGYETMLSQGGVNVSGGQKQRLCIARALLKKPKILILDDSTSAVDTATEARIRASFYTELQNTTVIIIAQRISSVMEADKIVVMDDGRIVGVGTHDILMKECEEYREIYESQSNREVTA